MSQTLYLKNISRNLTDSIHCFNQQEYEGILQMYYEQQALIEKNKELKIRLGIKDDALCLYEESMDSISSLLISTRSELIFDDIEIMSLTKKNKIYKRVAIASASITLIVIISNFLK